MRSTRTRTWSPVGSGSGTVVGRSTSTPPWRARTTARIVGSAGATPRVEAPRARARGREVEPHEAVEDGGDTLVHHRPEALHGVELEVRHRHFAGEHEGD